MKYDFSKILDRNIGDVLAIEGLGTHQDLHQKLQIKTLILFQCGLRI